MTLDSECVKSPAKPVGQCFPQSPPEALHLGAHGPFDQPLLLAHDGRVDAAVPRLTEARHAHQTSHARLPHGPREPTRALRALGAILGDGRVARQACERRGKKCFY